MLALTRRGDLTKVHAGSSSLHLTSVEQSLLYLLAANAGQLLTRNDIMDALWGVDYVAESNVVDRHIRNLRAKLQNDWRKPRFIKTGRVGESPALQCVHNLGPRCETIQGPTLRS